jgi:hypothetical protein
MNLYRDENWLAALNVVRQSFEQISAVEPDTLSREEEFGPARSMNDAVPILQRVKSLIDSIDVDTLEYLTARRLRELEPPLSACLVKINDLKSLSHEADATQRQAAISAFSVAVENLVDQLQPVAAFANTVSNQASAQISLAKEVLDESKVAASKTVESIKRAEKEAKDVVIGIRQAAMEAGVSQQALYFKELADGYSANADLWLHRSMVFGGVLVVLALFFLISAYTSWPLVTTEDLLRVTIAKVFVLFAISYGLVVSYRQYAAAKHNETVSRHRETALKTYKAIVEASGSEEGRDIILTHASESIFKLHSSGYVKSDADHNSDSLLGAIAGILSKRG